MNDVKDVLEKLRIVERRIADARGPFNLFALFLRANGPIGWDLVVSAPWARMDLATLRYLEAELRKELSAEDSLRIVRFVVIPPEFEGIHELAEEHPVEHGEAVIRQRDFGLQTVQMGYVITARPPMAEAA